MRDSSDRSFIRRHFGLLCIAMALASSPAMAQRLDWERSYPEPRPIDPRSDGPFHRGEWIVTAANGDLLILASLTGGDYAVERSDLGGGMRWTTRSETGDTTRWSLILWEEESSSIVAAGKAYILGPLSRKTVFFRHYHDQDGVASPPILSLRQEQDTTIQTILLDDPAIVRRLADGSFIGVSQLDFAAHNIALALRGITRDGKNWTWVTLASAPDSTWVAIPVDIVPLREGGDFAVIGWWVTPTGIQRTLALRFDSVGVMKWSAIPEGIDGRERRGFCSVVDGDGFVLLSNELWRENGLQREEIVLTRVRGDGQVDWERRHGAQQPVISGRRVYRLSDGGLVVVGSASTTDSSWFHVLRTNEAGEERWSKVWGGGRNNTLMAATLDSAGGIVVTGMTGVNRDLYLARLLEEPSSVDGGRIERDEGVFIVAGEVDGDRLVLRLGSPREAIVWVDVVDVLGRRVSAEKEERVGEGIGAYVFPLACVEGGIYVARVRERFSMTTFHFIVLP